MSHSRAVIFHQIAVAFATRFLPVAALSIALGACSSSATSEDEDGPTPNSPTSSCVYAPAQVHGHYIPVGSASSETATARLVLAADRTGSLWLYTNGQNQCSSPDSAVFREYQFNWTLQANGRGIQFAVTSFRSCGRRVEVFSQTLTAQLTCDAKRRIQIPELNLDVEVTDAPLPCNNALVSIAGVYEMPATNPHCNGQIFRWVLFTDRTARSYRLGCGTIACGYSAQDTQTPVTENRYTFTQTGAEMVFTPTEKYLCNQLTNYNMAPVRVVYNCADGGSITVHDGTSNPPVLKRVR